MLRISQKYIYLNVGYVCTFVVRLDFVCAQSYFETFRYVFAEIYISLYSWTKDKFCNRYYEKSSNKHRF